MKNQQLKESAVSLEELIQPRFFYGQLLTDADLNQLLEWTHTKFRLQRTIDGWGVVCGLQLSLDPAHRTHVILEPGQAIDCCGRDLIVYEPTSFDLSDACPKEECLEPSYDRWGNTSRDSNAKDSNEGAYQPPEPKPWSLHNLFEGSQVLDLFLHYSTEGSDSQVGLGRAGQGNECEYSRLKETVTLKWEPAIDLQKAHDESWNNFFQRYQAVRDVTQKYVDQAREMAQRGDPMKSWFLKLLEEQPLQEFGFVRDWINSMEPSDLANQAAKIMFFMRLDSVLTWLRCNCPSCGQETGLRVGRVWMQAPESSGSNNCRIIYVNGQPPLRRELHLDSCFPPSPGCVYLAPCLWQEWNSARESLIKQGVLIPGAPEEIPFDTLDWDMLEKIYSQSRVTNCAQDGSTTPMYVTVLKMDPPFGSRVVGFS